jgi:hypothetical protein
MYVSHHTRTLIIRTNQRRQLKRLQRFLDTGRLRAMNTILEAQSGVKKFPHGHLRCDSACMSYGANGKSACASPTITHINIYGEAFQNFKLNMHGIAFDLLMRVTTSISPLHFVHNFPPLYLSGEVSPSDTLKRYLISPRRGRV